MLPLVAVHELGDAEARVQPVLRGGLEVAEQQPVAQRVPDVRPHAAAVQHRADDGL